MSSSRARVPALLWLWTGPFIVVAQLVSKVIGEHAYRTWMRGELGLVENMTVAFLVGALVCALLCLPLRRRVRSRLFTPFLIVMALGLFFFAGEEASWGQHWFGFAPPEEIALRNDQGEFNLHNDPFFEKFLDQLPRTVLTLAALVGGVLGPLWRRRRGLVGRDFASASLHGWIWPPGECFPAALMALLITLPKKVADLLHEHEGYYLDISPGETKEYLLGLFLFVYLLALYLDLRAEAELTR